MIIESASKGAMIPMGIESSIEIVTLNEIDY